MGDKGLGFPSDGVDNQGWKLYILSLVMIITAGCFVVARCLTRLWMYKIGWDDATICVSLCFHPQISSIILSTAMQIAIEHGYGMHKSDLEPSEFELALKWFFIAQTPYKATVCLNKVAAILLYLRLFVTQSFRIACFVVMGIIVASSIGGIGATIWQCVPIEGAWNKNVDATCIDSNKFWMAYAIMNILTDVMVLALPIPPILRLQMSRRDKSLLCGIFLLGGFVTITSILRTTSVQNSLKNKQDSTYNFIERGMWTLAEANLGIISTCLPVLKRPMGKLFPRLFGSTKEDSSYFVNTGHDNSRGYNLSNMSTQGSHPGFWRGATKSHQAVSITGPKMARERTSDEQHIVTQSSKGSNTDGELSSRGSTINHGISKRVELVRTSFHEELR
ncbi:Fc.00g080880.m01.CDS01 [Cosmosporella sp. VM-42]